MAQTVIVPPLAQVDTPVNITDLTEGTFTGHGVLDTLLAVQRVHLDSQFEKDRIRGPEYADVYLGSYTATLSAAIEFLLQKERQGLELELLTEQIAASKAQTAALNAKLPLELKYLQAQIDNMTKQAELADKQILLATKDLDLKQKQIDLAAEQLKQAQAQTDYYKQKAINETAQTQSGIAKPGSVIGTQIDLMKAQEDGYQRNAEQQAAQIWANTWNVRRQTDDATVADTTNHLADADLGKVMQQLAKGINVTL